MIDIAGKLHESIAALAPIDGVYIGKMDDRKTWGIHFKPEATEAQRLQALESLQSFDVAKAETEIANTEVVTIEKLQEKINLLTARLEAVEKVK